MMRQLLQDFEQVFKVFVSVFNDDLEWTEQFGGDQVSLLFTSKMLNWHLDSSGLVRTIACWNSMVSEWDTTEEEFSTIKFETSVNMSLDLLVVPGNNWPDSQILKLSLCGLSSHLFKDICLSPVFVIKHYGLGGAFLTSVSICIMIALPGDVINITLSLWYVWTQNLPVVASIFKSDSSVEFFHEVFADL